MDNIVIVGPTASGKTAVAAALSKIINGEIISADSRQIYKYLDIGTNKSGKWDEGKNCRYFEGIAQHLTDICEPDEFFSAGDFERLALEKIGQIRENGKVPVIAGGTGLYIKALVDGLSPMPTRDERIRSELKKKFLEKGAVYLYEKLKRVDPESAETNKKNPQRLIRALEIYEISGIPASVFKKNVAKPREHFVQFGLNFPRAEIYERINRRSSDMLSGGIIQETEKVIDMGFPETSEAFKGIGYKDVLSFIKGKINKEELEEFLKRGTRRYAKRQITWFKKDKRINWINLEGSTFYAEKVAAKILKTVDNLI